MKQTLSLLIVTVVLAVGAYEASSQAKDIRWGTSAVGSSGYRALVSLAGVLNREMPAYKFTALPMPGAIVTMKAYATGQIDAYYGSDIAFYELASDTNRFKGFKAQLKRSPVQSLWTYTVEVGIGIRARDREKYRQWRDLGGKRVFTGPLPWDTRAHMERAFQALGVKHQYVEVDLATAGSLLEQGGIEAFTVYTNAEAAVPPWIIETSLVTDWAILNPSPEEAQILRKAGFPITELDPKVFKRNVYVDKVVFLPYNYGFHVGLEVPDEDVYRMLTVVEKKVDELAKASVDFEQIRKDMVGMQRKGVESSIEYVPVHPGLARWMREKGVWDSKWDARIAKR